MKDEWEHRLLLECNTPQQLQDLARLARRQVQRLKRVDHKSMFFQVKSTRDWVDQLKHKGANIFGTLQNTIEILAADSRPQVQPVDIIPFVYRLHLLAEPELQLFGLIVFVILHVFASVQQDDRMCRKNCLLAERINCVIDHQILCHLVHAVGQVVQVSRALHVAHQPVSYVV
jgi:hypothetical protein